MRRPAKKSKARRAMRPASESQRSQDSVRIVVHGKVLPGFRLFLLFDDGTEGELDLSAHLSGPIFEPLKDERYFAQGRVDHELGTVVWPNGADFAPEFLYDELRARGEPIIHRAG